MVGNVWNLTDGGEQAYLCVSSSIVSGASYVSGAYCLESVMATQGEHGRLVGPWLRLSRGRQEEGRFFVAQLSCVSVLSSRVTLDIQAWFNEGLVACRCSISWRLVLLGAAQMVWMEIGGIDNRRQEGRVQA